MPPDRPLAGRKAWLITDDKIGMQVQVRGVADALGLDWELKQVAPSGLWRTLAPFGPPDPKDRPGAATGSMQPPWPEFALATGRLSIPYIRALRRKAGLSLYSVVLQDPRTSAGTADLIWVPEHDKRRGPNVMTTLTAAHSFTPERLAKLATVEPAWLQGLAGPRIGVILGGPNQVYKYSDEDDARLGTALASFASLGASFLITPSRRTHAGLRHAVTQAVAGKPHFFWDGQGENPYPAILAHADAFIVTGDSVNMTGEPLITGKPVWVYEPGGGSDKFRRFHASLRRYGATRSLPAAVKTLDSWSYVPLDAAATIAREIERRWLQRQAMLGVASGRL